MQVEPSRAPPPHLCWIWATGHTASTATSAAIASARPASVARHACMCRWQSGKVVSPVGVHVNCSSAALAGLTDKVATDLRTQVDCWSSHWETDAASFPVCSQVLKGHPHLAMGGGAVQAGSVLAAVRRSRLTVTLKLKLTLTLTLTLTMTLPAAAEKSAPALYRILPRH